MKKFLYKVYSFAGAYVGTLSPNRVASLPTYNEKINGGQGQMSITYFIDFDDFGEDILIKHMNFIRVYEIDEENKLGRIIYTGFISQYAPFIKGAQQGVRITLLGLVSLLSLAYFKDGTNYTRSYSSIDPSVIATEIITHFNSVYGGSWIGTSGGNVQSVGTPITYSFEDRTWLDALNDTFSYSSGGWWWRINKDGELYLKPKPSSATHTFTIGKDLEEIEVSKTNEKIKNALQYRYDSGASISDYSDSASQTAYGKREEVYNNDGTTNSSTIDQYGDKFIADNKDPKVRARLVVNSNYDIESIEAGETCNVRNFKNGSTVLPDNMQIVSIQYAPDKVVLLLEEDVSFGKELEALARSISESSS